MFEYLLGRMLESLQREVNSIWITRTRWEHKIPWDSKTGTDEAGVENEDFLGGTQRLCNTVWY